MSSVICEVVEIEKIRPHPDADRLFLAQIKGWQTVIRKLEDGSPEFREGDRVVYVPPDSTLPREMAEKFGVVDYLSEKEDLEGVRRLVVRRARLRGEPSYGFVVAPEDPGWPVGTDVRGHYGVGKYQPPVKFTAGDSEAQHPRFQKYTDIENLRNFPGVFAAGEDVVVTEKIHGTNARIGYVEGRLLAGSHGLQRRRPEPEEMAVNTYWFPATLEPVVKLLDDLRSRHEVAILYGEVYGSKIQKLHYGRRGGLGFAAFDLLLDERYVDYDHFHECCERHGVPTVPSLYRGPYSLVKVKELSGGKTTLADEHIREGVVVRPSRERYDEKVGRAILKYLNDDYLLNAKLTDADATDL